MKILIVEDDAATRFVLNEIVSNFCKEKNNICLEADSISQAKEVLKTHCPDIVLLDIFLKGDFGTPLIPYIREKCKTKKPKIIVMSALSKVDNLVEEHSPDAIIVKPFELETLMEYLE